MASNSRFAMAVHIISVLASRRNDVVPSADIAFSVNTNPVVVRRILTDLTKAGITESIEGKNGGTRLRLCPEEISLWDIYKALGQERLFAVHENPVKRSCPISCRMKDVLGTAFGKAEAAARKELQKINVGKLVGEVLRA